MKLSDRLQSLADYFSPEEMFHSRALVLEAMELAKSVESAPVAELKWDWFSADLAQGIIRIDKPSPERMEAARATINSQRVALVPLPQQSES